jgi:hypothetical protein
MTLSMTTFRIMSLRVTTFSITTLHNDTHRDDIQSNDTWHTTDTLHNIKNILLSLTMMNVAMIFVIMLDVVEPLNLVLVWVDRYLLLSGRFLP